MNEDLPYNLYPADFEDRFAPVYDKRSIPGKTEIKDINTNPGADPELDLKGDIYIAPADYYDPKIPETPIPRQYIPPEGTRVPPIPDRELGVPGGRKVEAT